MTEPAFRRGRPGHISDEKILSLSDLDVLSEGEKEQICRELLAEFGVDIERITSDGEMIHKCSLPYHNESHASASLNYKLMKYNCFVCGGGSIFWWIGMCRNQDTDEVRSWLKDYAGINRERTLEDLLRYFDAIWNRQDDRIPPPPRMSTRILDPMRAIHPYLTDPKPYGRAIPEQTLIDFDVCYDSEHNRVVFPHFWHGDLVGWQSRRIFDDGSEKYKNTAEFPKDTTIYNYDRVRATSTEAVVFESVSSVLSKWHLDQRLVSTFGAEVNDRQIQLLSQFEKVILWFDNDTAGWKATQNIGDRLMASTNVYTVESPWAADPGDVDDETYLGLITAPIPYALWRIPEHLKEWAHA